MPAHDEFLRDLAWKASRSGATLETFATDYVCDDHVLPSERSDLIRAMRQAFLDGLRFPSMVRDEREATETEDSDGK